MIDSVSSRRPVLQRLASCPNVFFREAETYVKCKPKLRFTMSSAVGSDGPAAHSADAYNNSSTYYTSALDLPDESSLNGLASSLLEECMDVFLGSIVLPALLLVAICTTFIFLPNESRSGVLRSVFAVFAVVVGFGAESLLTTWANHGRVVGNLFRMTYS